MIDGAGSDQLVEESYRMNCLEPQVETRKRSNVHVAIGTLSEPSGEDADSIYEDGKRIAKLCLAQLDLVGREYFPPRLFNLWVTPAYESSDEFRSFLYGIRDELAFQLDESNTPDRSSYAPLIGTTASAVFSDGIVYERGAILACHSSDWISAKVGVSQISGSGVEETIGGLLRQLSPNAEELSMDPSSNRYLTVYLSGYENSEVQCPYIAPELVSQLNLQTFGRLPLFGGVSSAGIAKDRFSTRQGHQFLNDRSYTNTVVAALVTSDPLFGIGMNAGVSTTNQFVHVKDHSLDMRTIQNFEQGSSNSVFKAFDVDGPFVFASRNSEGLLTVNVPLLKGSEIHLSRPLLNNLTLRVARPSAERLVSSVNETKNWILRSSGMEESDVVSVFSVACISWYRDQDRLSVPFVQELTRTGTRFPNAIYVGCFLDGEIGSDPMGRSSLGNWSTAECMTADCIASETKMSSAFNALASKLAQAPINASLADTMRLSLEIIKSAGFSGGMISLIFKDEPTDWIRGASSFGKGWTDVKANTAREVNGIDILALAANEKNVLIVENAQIDDRCENDVARKGGVVSFGVMRLMDEGNSSPIGLLQIDLGDVRRRRIDKELPRLLETLGRTVELFLNRAIRDEESKVTRELDRIAEASLLSENLESAVQHFLSSACQQLDLVGHVRLVSDDQEALRVVGGYGDYYEFIRKHRVDVRINDPSSSTAKALHLQRDRIVNRAGEDPTAMALREHFKDNPKAHDALRKNLSFVNCLIKSRGEVIGVLDLGSPYAWEFTATKIRIIEAVRCRLSLLVDHFRERMRRTTSQKNLAGIELLLVRRLHRMKNIVKEVQSACQFVREKLHSESSGEFTQIASAEDRLERLLEIFRESLYHGKLLSNSPSICSVSSLELGRRAMDICRRKMMREARERHLVPTTDLQFECISQNSVLNIEVAEDLVLEALCNLIANGINQVFPSGWVKLSVEAEISSGQIGFVIQDSGTRGFSQTDFSRYTSEECQSDSLGLYLAKLFCEANGGSLKLEKPGDCPVFRMTYSLRNEHQ